MATTFRRSRILNLPARAALRWLAFFLIIVGARFCLIAQFGSSLPLMDQWDGEAVALYQPYLEGKLQLGDFFTPHTESRMLPSRLLALGLLALNGQWDGRLQMAANAIIFALMAVAFAAVAIRLIGKTHETAVLCAVAAWGALPFAWENTTWGFQSSFYFLIFFSFVAVWGLGLHRALSAQWIAGAAVALLAGLSMASGVVVVAALAAVELLRLVTGRKARRDVWPTLAFCFAAAVWLVYIRSAVSEHEVFKAQTAWHWLKVFSSYLAWPYSSSFACIIMYLPLAVLFLMYLKSAKETENREGEKFAAALLAVGGWVMLQAAGIAYARGGQSTDVAPSRYMDIFAVGALTNFLALLLLFDRRHMPRVLPFAATLWTVGVAVGVGLVSYEGLEKADEKARIVREGQERIRAYVATKDRRVLAPIHRSTLPYPWPDRLAELLDDERIAGILPAAIRKPLRLEPEGDASSFVAEEAVHEGSGLNAGRTWSSEAPLASSLGGTMRSQVIHPTLPYLRFETFGSLGSKMSLHLQSDDTGRKNRFVPASRDAQQWRHGFVTVTEDTAVRVLARDENPNGWFRFREPAEVGLLSYWAEQLLERAAAVLLCGFAIAFGLLCYTHLQRRRSAETS